MPDSLYFKSKLVGFILGVSVLWQSYFDDPAGVDFLVEIDDVVLECFVYF